MKQFTAISGAIGAALFVAACSSQTNKNEFCAMDGDGQLVSTTDGKNFSPMGAAWVEGSTGWNRDPICVASNGSAPPERTMPMKDLPRNATVNVVLEPGY